MNEERIADEIRSLREEVQSLRLEIRGTLPSHGCSVKEACERYRFSRSAWDRWLADPRAGLREIVSQPSGPGGRIVIQRARLEEWLNSRGPGVARRQGA